MVAPRNLPRSIAHGYINHGHWGERDTPCDHLGTTAAWCGEMPRKMRRSSAPSLLRPQLVEHPMTNPPNIQFWTNMYSMDVASGECISAVQSLLSCPSKISLARNFRGNEAQTFIDFLDQVSYLSPSCYYLAYVPHAGPRALVSRWPVLAKGLTAYSQNLQSTEDRAFIVSPASGTHPHR